MTRKQFIRELTKREEKKRQVNIADMSEIQARICDIFAQLPVLELVKLILDLREAGEQNKITNATNAQTKVRQLKTHLQKETELYFP